MSIFDQQDDEVDEFAEDSDGVKFTLEFGVEEVDIPLGKYNTVADAFRAKADYLGFNFDQMLTYRNDNSDLLEGGEVPQAGAVYTAAITHDTKGI